MDEAASVVSGMKEQVLSRQRQLAACLENAYDGKLPADVEEIFAPFENGRPD